MPSLAPLLLVMVVLVPFALAARHPGQANSMPQPGTTGRRWSRGFVALIAITLASLILWIVWVVDAAQGGHGTQKRLAVYTAGVVTLLIIWSLLGALQDGILIFKGIFTGQDGRPSTSLFQFFLWTIVTLYAFVSVFAARFVVPGSDITKVAQISIPPTLLLAMGASVSTALIAKGITSNQVGSGQIVKTPTPSSSNAPTGPASGGPTGGAADTPTKPDAGPPREAGAAAPARTGRLSHIFLADNDQTDLPKVQMLAWTFIAAGTYLFSVVNAVSTIMAQTTWDDKVYTLPDIASALVVLTGLGQGTYLGTKLILASTPQVSAIAPPKGDENTQLVLTGAGFGDVQGGSLLYLKGYPVNVGPSSSNDQNLSGDHKPTFSWTDQRITFNLPTEDPMTGKKWEPDQMIAVRVAVGGQLSNAVGFHYTSVGDT